jgi:hypothetical protein
MKHITIAITLLFTILLTGNNISSVNAQTSPIYYFYAENCSACKQAESYYKKPSGIKDGSSWQHGGKTFIPYRIVDGNNKVQMNNIKKLTDMCDAISKKLGTDEFVYFRREKYKYYKKDRLPYYKNDSKYSRKNDAFPTPVFIIGDRVVLGFNLTLIEQSIKMLK